MVVPWSIIGKTIYLFGKSSEIIQFCATSQFWHCWLPKNDGFWLLSSKLFTQSTSISVCTVIWCVIQFWATLAQFWPIGGPQMTENGGFPLLSEKLFTQSISNLVYVFVGWLFRTDLPLDHVGPVLVYLVAKNDGFRVQKFFHFQPCGQIFAPPPPPPMSVRQSY